MIEPGQATTVRVKVNGVELSGEAQPRLLLSDFLRHRLRLTGTHVGCEHGVCGACTVLLDGEPVRSCLVFAVQVDSTEIVTVEGLAPDGHELHPLQQAFHDHHAMQCGFCTPGFLVSLLGLLKANPDPSDDELLDSLSGNLCRCTGYANILAAARTARERMRP